MKAEKTNQNSKSIVSMSGTRHKNTTTTQLCLTQQLSTV